MRAFRHDLAVSFDRDFASGKLEPLDERCDIQRLVETVRSPVDCDLYHGGNDTVPGVQGGIGMA